MKLKKIIISIFIILGIVNINSESSAKYVIEYTKKAAEIVIKN